MHTCSKFLENLYREPSCKEAESWTWSSEWRASCWYPHPIQESWRLLGSPFIQCQCILKWPHTKAFCWSVGSSCCRQTLEPCQTDMLQLTQAWKKYDEMCPVIFTKKVMLSTNASIKICSRQKIHYIHAGIFLLCYLPNIDVVCIVKQVCNHDISCCAVHMFWIS